MWFIAAHHLRNTCNTRHTDSILNYSVLVLIHRQVHEFGEKRLKLSKVSSVLGVVKQFVQLYRRRRRGKWKEKKKKKKIKEN